MRYLIARINNCNDGVAFPSKILADCKAEIERLLLANETLKALNAEYAERIRQHGIAQESMNHANWIARQEAQESQEAMAFVFVYKHKVTGKIDTASLSTAYLFEENSNYWDLIASLNAVEWVRCNYENITANIQQVVDEIDGLHRNGDGLYIYADKIDAILDKWRTK